MFNQLEMGSTTNPVLPSNVSALPPSANANLLKNPNLNMHLVEKMRMQEKYFKAARYLKCCEMADQQAFCPCEGWKPMTQEEIASNGSMTKEDARRCATCKHRIISHGNLTKLRPEDVEKIYSYIGEIEKHLKEASVATDPQKKSLCIKSASQLRQIIQRPSIATIIHQQQQMQLQQMDSQPIPPPSTVDPSSLARYDPLNSNFKSQNSLQPMNGSNPFTNGNISAEPITNSNTATKPEKGKKKKEKEKVQKLAIYINAYIF